MDCDGLMEKMGSNLCKMMCQPISMSDLRTRDCKQPNSESQEMSMATQGFLITHAKDGQSERGLRSFFACRDLGLGRPLGCMSRSASFVPLVGANFSAGHIGITRHFSRSMCSRAGSSLHTRGRVWFGWKPARACTSRPGSDIGNWGAAKMWSCSNWCCSQTSRLRRSTASTL